MEGLIIFTFIAVIVVAIVVAMFVIYRRGLRFAKSIERGIKMVPILISLPPSSEDIEVGGRDVRDVIQERISQAEVLYNLIASTATKGFKSKFFGQRHIGLEIVAIDGVIRFYAAVPVALVSVVKQAILTAYPGSHLEEVEDHNIFSETGKISGTYGGEIVLKQSYAYPIATANELKRDAMQAVIKSLTNLEQGDGAGMQILLRPARDNWTKASESLVRKKRGDKGDSSGGSAKALLQAPFKAPEASGDKEQKPPKQLTSLEQATLDAIEQKTKSSGYEVSIRIVASSGTASRSQTIVHNIVSALSLFDAPGLNGFKFQPAKNMEKFVTDFIFRFFPPEQRKTILNSVELASLFHFPDDQFSKTTQLQRQSSKQVEGPTHLSKDGLVLGHNTYHGVKKEIRLSDEDRRRHVYIVGQTGTGKSTMLENLMIQDMSNGKGFAFIDPHGDTAEKMLGVVPKDRTEDVIYFDPGDLEHPLGLNIFEYQSEDQKDFLIQEAINMLYRLYDPQHTGIIGPRYEHLFRNAALTVMAGPEGGTFVDIPKLFRDPQFVKQKLKYVQDQSVREFWQKEMPQSQRSNDFGEIVSWFVSKFGAFLSNQLMRNTIGQTKSAFDLRELMDSNKILIANLSKGRLGELNSQLLGMIFVMKFQAAAMSRANVPEDQRKDFSLYVDEFQNFSTESFAFILSEARKYRMNLIVANQFISQLSEEVRDAVFGNVGTILSYRTGPTDADFLVKQFAPAFTERDLVNLPNFNAAIRLMSGGLPSQPFNIAALPPLATSNPHLAGALKQLSAAKHARPRAAVEKEIFDRLSVKQAPSPFDSLASSRGIGGPGASDSPQKPSVAPSSASETGENSFLDEWLAKRKQVLAQQKQSPTPPKPVDKPSLTPPQPVAQPAPHVDTLQVPAVEPPTPAEKDEPSDLPKIQRAAAPPQSNFSTDPPSASDSKVDSFTDNIAPADLAEPASIKKDDDGRTFLGSAQKENEAREEADEMTMSSPELSTPQEPEESQKPGETPNSSGEPLYSPDSTKSHFSTAVTPPEKTALPVEELLTQSDEGGIDTTGEIIKPTKPAEPVSTTPTVQPQPAPLAPSSYHDEEPVGVVEPDSASPEHINPKSLDAFAVAPEPETGSIDEDNETDAPVAESVKTDDAKEGSSEPISTTEEALDQSKDLDPESESEPETEPEVEVKAEEKVEAKAEEALASIGAQLEKPDAAAKPKTELPPSEEPTKETEQTEDKDETTSTESAESESKEVEANDEPEEAKPDEAPPPAAPVDPAVASLKPGEIYIDDEGNIHQG